MLPSDALSYLCCIAGQLIIWRQGLIGEQRHQAGVRGHAGIKWRPVTRAADDHNVGVKLRGEGQFLRKGSVIVLSRDQQNRAPGPTYNQTQLFCAADEYYRQRPSAG